jgi:hypothetical protein
VHALIGKISATPCDLYLIEGRRDRATDGDLVSRAIVLSLTRACGIVGKVGFGATAVAAAKAERPLWVR